VPLRFRPVRPPASGPLGRRAGDRRWPYPRRMELNDADVFARLLRVVNGDTSELAELTRVGNASVFNAWHSSGSPAIVVPREAVISVLEGMLDRSVTPELARDWAFLVRHGCIGGWSRTAVENDPSGVVEKAEATVWKEELPIDWEESFEDEINEATYRLDEIGDLIDGVVTDEEIRAFLAGLDGSKP